MIGNMRNHERPCSQWIGSENAKGAEIHKEGSKELKPLRFKIM